MYVLPGSQRFNGYCRSLQLELFLFMDSYLI